jgi:dihydroorotase
MLVDNDTLEKYFQVQTCAVHCEDELPLSNLEKYKAEFGEDIPVTAHILSDLKKLVIFLLQRRSLLPKKQARVACFHLSTAKEMSLFTNKIPWKKENYCEVCIHHLWFTNEDYATKNLINGTQP